jgi:NAD+ kinase
MRVLAVVKTTNYELHGPNIEVKVAEGRVAGDALRRLKTAHREHYETLTALRAAFVRERLAFDEVSRDGEPHPRRAYDAVVTVGGDGTLLAASHQMAAGGKILGLRSSVSSVGYLCCAGPNEVDALVKGIKEGTHTWLEVSRVKAEINSLDARRVIETVPVLNDFLYTNTNPSATTRYRLHFRDRCEVHRSSGLWVATAVGSTAGIFAAGGVRRPLSDRLFQFKVRELYRLGLTEPTLDGGLFDPDADLLEVENRCPSATLALDGQHGAHELGYGDKVRFRRAASVLLAQPRHQR